MNLEFGVGGQNYFRWVDVLVGTRGRRVVEDKLNHSGSWVRELTRAVLAATMVVAHLDKYG